MCVLSRPPNPSRCSNGDGGPSRRRFNPLPAIEPKRLKQMGEQYDDLKLRIDQINQARRHLGQSVDASGHVLRRVLHRAGGAPPRLHAEGSEPNENWPRPPSLASRSYSGVAVIVVISVVALLAALVERRWPVSQ